jgi:phytoene synthase
VAGKATAALLGAVRDWRAAALHHLAEAQRAVAVLPAAIRPIFRSLALVPLYLGVVARRDYDPFRTSPELPQWRRQWALWRGLARPASRPRA